MTTSQNGIDFIAKEEGCILHVYKDSAGIPTIGIGTIRYPNGMYVTMNDPDITFAEAEDYLRYEVKAKEAAVNSMIEGLNINQNQFDAVVSFAYNCGVGALHGSTLLRLIKENVNDPGITAAFEMWDKARIDGQLTVVEGLLGRRKREASLYFTTNSL